MTIRLVVVDDQDLVRAGFRMILESESDFEVAGEAANGREALDVVRATDPDVVLMDIRMPVMDGVEATRRLTTAANGTGAKVLILTTFDLDEYVVEALRAGASGFLLKDVRAEDLIDAVRVIAAGDALLAPSVTRKLLDKFAATRREPDKDARAALESMTEREREILGLVARGMSNAEIARAIVVAETTVKTHVSHVLMKAAARDRAQLVVFAYESGLVQPGER